MIKNFEKEYYEEDEPEYYIEGKPLYIELNGNESIKELWNIILNSLEQALEDIRTYFNPPIITKKLEDMVSEVEHTVFKKYPDELKELYACNNGHNTNFEGIFLGMNFFSFDDMLERWKHLINVSKMDNSSFDKECSSVPQDYIKTQDANSLWIPFATDICGNYFGIDLDPGKNGTIGQIINFGRDEREKVVLANSLKEFLILVINELRKGNFLFEGDDEQDRVYFKLKDDVHPIEEFKKIAKEK